MEKKQVVQWFVDQTQSDRNLALLYVAKELTLVTRNVSTLPNSEHEHKLAVGWIISECQHKILGYVTAAMTGADRYPDELIVSFACDYVDDPVIQHYTRDIWKTIIGRAERLANSSK